LFLLDCIMIGKIFTVVFIVLAPCAFAQTFVQDSLLSILKTNPQEDIAFAAYQKLGELSTSVNPHQATVYFLKALSLPLRSEYSKEFTQCYQSLGDLYHTFGLYDSSVLMHRNAFFLAQKFQYKKEMGLALQGIGLGFLRLQNADSARFYFNQALPLFIELKEPILEGQTYILLGNVSLNENDYPQSLSLFIKAANFLEHSDPVGLARAYVNIANIENILDEQEKALEYSQRALKLALKNNSQAIVAYAHGLRGRVFRKLKKQNEALTEYQQAISLYRQMADVRNESEIAHSIGNIYFDRGGYKEASTYYYLSLRLSKRINNSRMIAHSYSALGNTFYSLKNYARSLAYIDSSLVFSRLSKSPYLEMDAYELMSGVYESQKKYEQALYFLQKFSTIKDSITQAENKTATQELEAKYANSKKQNEIELLQKDQLLKNISLKQSRTLEIALGLLFVLLVVIGVLMFNQQKMINRSKRQMEIEKIRNQIARDLHDDMGSTLSSITIFSQLGAKEENNPTLIKYFQRISEHSSKMMENMADMVWSINPDNDSFQKTVAKMKEFSSEILEPKNIGYQFEVEESLHNILLHSVKRKNLYLIFKEAVNNAAKYSGGNFIHINFQRKENELFLSVRDNGKGFDPVKKSMGNGLGNMKERASSMNGRVNIISSPGEGVAVEVRVALT